MAWYAIADDIEMTPYLMAQCERLANRYHDMNGRALLVTSGNRGVERQARAMYDNYRLGAGVVYKRADLEKDVRRVYDMFYGKPEVEALSAMAAMLLQQVQSGQYISAHMSGKACDFGLTDLKVADFEECVKALGHFGYLEKYCYHVTFADN